jgi:hypothetical protein
MKKKIFTFLLFIFLSSCGYEAVYSVKNRVNYSFSINELTLAGDRQVNLRIKQRLTKYKNPSNEKQKSFSLEISSKSEKIITAKDASGDAIKFKNELTINALVFMNGEYRTNLVIIENFIYDNNSDIFELRAYENQIKNNLAGAAVNKILTKLANIL